MEVFMNKDTYQISIWEDILVSGTKAHYEEQELAIIGSDTMTAPYRAIEPKLVQNINGSNILTFKLYYTYIDTETGKRESNPFIKLLVNERRVKCKWKNEWYDFVIKSIQEDSNNKSITYTCKDLFINELSKTGFNLIFDNELENNQGTAQELGKKVLEGTDWEVANEGQDTIQQTIEEPLYELFTKSSFWGKSSDGKNSFEVPGFVTILVPYSIFQKPYPQFFQFFYSEDGNYSKYQENNSVKLTNIDCCFSDKPFIVAEKESGEKVVTIDGVDVLGLPSGHALSDWRADRLVIAPIQEFSTLVNRYCYVYDYDKGGDWEKKLYKYIKTEYNDPTVVLNLVVNSKEFKDTLGWVGEDLKWELYPPYSNITNINELQAYNATTYLKLGKNKTVFNTGLQKSSMYVEDGFQTGDRYIFRVKGSPTLGETTNLYKKLTPIICEREADSYEPKKEKPNIYFTVKEPAKFVDGWTEYELECTLSISQAEMQVWPMGLFIKVENEDCWIKEFQFFKEVMGKDGARINPGEMEKQSVATEVYCYFDANDKAKDPKDINYLWKGTTDWSNEKLAARYPKDSNGNYSYEKIRSITGKNSNRFNLLQSIAETFECWVRFEIQHDKETGRMIYIDGKPQKKVYFKKNVGKEIGYGFVYGIDLKAISRTINSEQITSKVIVVPNVNEYAENGVCEIAQSDFNPCKENFILNFDYYINQGLLDSGAINGDLWLSPINGSLGYYPTLKALNSHYYSLVEEYTVRKTELDKQKSMLKVYEQYKTSTAEQITSVKSDIARLIGLEEYGEEAVLQYIKTHPNYDKLETSFVSLKTLENNLKEYGNIVKSLNASITSLNTELESNSSSQKKDLEDMEALHKSFYEKYSRFLQEGSWTSNDYLNKDLYYLDATSVAYTSSRPQISYNISVLRLTSLEEFRGKVFNIGDITYVEDTEFFGYTYIKGTDGSISRTPYREKALISEITSNFDSPEKDSFKVQNYKTQFEDLFQRITATTQSLQYSKGEYQRAANIVTPEGVINQETLQASIANNANLVYNSQNNTIVQDATGITLVDKSNPSYQTKITSGGLFITTDGGTTWKNAIRGEGVATQYLTAGSINTGNITILDGINPSFRWDNYGINAYKKHYEYNEDGTIKTFLGISPQNFVRFDQYGIYGIDGFKVADDNNSKEYIPANEDAIWNDAKFGLTWKGFFLKNKSRNGTVEISSENDITVNEGNITRIQIGGIGTKEIYEKTSDTKPIEGKKYYKRNEGETVYTEVTNILENDNPSEKGYYEIFEGTAYGIRIKDEQGITVMETSDNGKLWLKNSLYLGDGTTSDVRIGYFHENEEVSSPYNVINANNNFIVYPDGTMVARSGQFSGIITAAKLGTNNTYIDESGLTFINSGLHAYVEKEGQPRKEVLSFENGNLHISGDISGSTGTFSGDISGATGTFSGNITAAGGTIGGFTISEKSLTSTDEKNSIILNGSNGTITANNIILGIGAKIADYIKLGENVKLRTPTNDKPNFLEVSSEDGVKISIDENCVMKLGELTLNGNASTIKGKNFEINPEKAIFKNIIAQGGTIENVVFKKSSVQSVGGQMIFKPSAHGTFSRTGSNLFFTFDSDSNDEKITLAEGDIVFITSANGTDKKQLTIPNQSGESNSLIINLGDINGFDGSGTIMKLAGKSGANSYENALLMGINPDDTSTGVRDANTHLFKESFSFIAPKISETGEVNYDTSPVLLLGNLSTLGKADISGYGLYGENVYLHGALTTELNDKEKTFAGINTTSPVITTKFLEDETDRIVFWAGANDYANIQNAPFFVTNKGNLYAKEGIFEGSLISKSRIQSAIIYAAEIHGSQMDGQGTAPLTIYDTTQGIRFCKEDEASGVNPTLEITSDAFKHFGKNFIVKEEEGANVSTKFIGKYQTVEAQNGVGCLLIQNEKIENIISQDGGYRSNSIIDFSEGKIKLFTEQIQQLEIDSSQIRSAAPSTIAEQNVIFGTSQTHLLKYQKMGNGYNLYVS